MNDAKVLIVSATNDWSAQQVAEQLANRGADHCWLDPSDFPKSVQISATLNHGWRGCLVTPGGSVRWEEITAVYYRRPRDFRMPADMSEPERRFARAQARVGLGGILASLPVRWINHPAALADHEYKPAQLRLAESVGMTMPATLVTNDAEKVRRFAADIGEIIVKPLAEPLVPESGSASVVWTRRVTTSDLHDLAGVELTAHLFQQWLAPKAFEVRITVVGHRLFCVAIYAGSDAALIDWRSDYGALSYKIIECPAWLRDAIRAYMAAARLSYAAFDFVVTEGAADYYFLECNSAGQWGWLAEECGLPIAESIAAELIGDST